MRTRTALIFVPSLAAALAVACGTDTGGDIVEFDVTIGGSGLTSVNDHGWTVTVTDARACLGGVYFFEGEPFIAGRIPLDAARERLATRIASGSTWARLAGVFSVRSAHAHPGHYDEGTALAELRSQEVFDLSTARSLGTAHGVTGRYASALVTFAACDALGGETIRIAGTATKDGTDVPFELSLTLEELVSGIGVAGSPTIDATGGTATVTVDVATWVRSVDFSLLTGGDPDPAGALYSALLRGVLSHGAFLIERNPS